MLGRLSLVVSGKILVTETLGVTSFLFLPFFFITERSDVKFFAGLTLINVVRGW